jgi:hypothetical protein
MNIISKLFFGMVRESSAICRTHLVDTAIVCLQVEELARLCFIQPVTTPVFAQPFLLEIVGFHFQKTSDTLDICRRIGRRHRFTTVGATQAIYFLPDLAICIVNQTGDTARGQFSNTAQESFKGSSMKFYLPSEGA